MNFWRAVSWDFYDRPLSMQWVCVYRKTTSYHILNFSIRCSFMGNRSSAAQKKLGDKSPFFGIFRTVHHNFAMSFRNNANEFKTASNSGGDPARHGAIMSRHRNSARFGQGGQSMAWHTQDFVDIITDPPRVSKKSELCLYCTKSSSRPRALPGLDAGLDLSGGSGV